MIKLQDLLKENINSPGFNPEAGNEDDLLKKGYKLSKPEVDPETGTSTTTVTYLPKLKQIRIELYRLRNQFMPYKYSSNPDIAKVAKEISTNMTKLNNMILALDGMIEAEKQK
jgi:hypothetical protein